MGSDFSPHLTTSLRFASQEDFIHAAVEPAHREQHSNHELSLMGYQIEPQI